MTEQWERTMDCKDHVGRARNVRVFLDIDSASGKVLVGLHVPAGEVAKFQPGQLSLLQDYIAAARLEAVRRGGVWE